MIMVGFVVILTGSLPNEIICKIISIEFKVMTQCFYFIILSIVRLPVSITTNQSHNHPFMPGGLHAI